MRCSFLVMAAAIVIATASSAGGPAAAADESKDSDAFTERLFAHAVDKQNKSYACFVRRYDPTHLARHPLQKVSAMKLLVTAEMLPEAESLSYSFQLGLRFRHRPGDYDSGGGCGYGNLEEGADNKAQLHCSVECDGGGIAVELAADNKSILVSLDRIRVSRSKADDGGFELSGGADDRAFRLHRVRLDDCRSLVTDKEELAALRQK